MIGYTLLKKLMACCVIATGLMSATVWAGFSLSGTQLLDGNGQPFIMRGINHAHTWFASQTNSAIPNIANTGANVVRVVLSNGTHKEGLKRTPESEVSNIITSCKNNRIVCILEVHDTTGYGEKAEATTLAQAAQYWVSLASILRGQENYVLINIGNEPFGNNQAASAWVDQHRAAIRTIRNANLTHTLVVDAPSWGQDWQEVMLRDL
jgi:mannan endo-1,4-beta-mannosidase